MTLADPCPGEDDGTDCDTTTRHPAHVVSVGAERRRVAGRLGKVARRHHLRQHRPGRKLGLFADRMQGLVPGLAGPVRVNRPSGCHQSGAARPKVNPDGVCCRSIGG